MCRPDHHGQVRLRGEQSGRSDTHRASRRRRHTRNTQHNRMRVQGLRGSATDASSIGKQTNNKEKKNTAFPPSPND